MKRMFYALAILPALAACGGVSRAPELSEITLSQTDIGYADEFFASFEARDADGDLYRGTVAIRVHGPLEDEEVELENIVDVTEASVGQTEVPMAVGLRLTGQMPLGVYGLEVRVTDNDGNESDPAKTRINVGGVRGRVIPNAT